MGLDSPCNVTASEVILQYKDILGQNTPTANSEEIIEQTINEIENEEDINFPFECIKIQSLVDKLIEHPDINNSSNAGAAYIIQLNYLSTLLGWSEQQYNNFFLDIILNLGGNEDEIIVNGIYQNLANGAYDSCCEEENYNGCIENDILSGCFGDYADYMNNLGISFEDLLDGCNENHQDNPSCNTCTPEQEIIVFQAHEKAMEMLECTIDYMESYDGVTPSFVRTCLETHYDGANSVIFNDLIKSLLRTIQVGLRNQSYQIQGTGEGFCSPGVSAWTLPGTYPFSNLVDIRLCNPEWFNKTPLERAGTIIHEGAHVFLARADLAYDWDYAYHELNTLQQLLNADSFSELSKCICP